jgi:hypothetical protein
MITLHKRSTRRKHHHGVLQDSRGQDQPTDKSRSRPISEKTLVNRPNGMRSLAHLSGRAGRRGMKARHDGRMFRDIGSCDSAIHFSDGREIRRHETGRNRNGRLTAALLAAIGASAQTPETVQQNLPTTQPRSHPGETTGAAHRCRQDAEPYPSDGATDRAPPLKVHPGGCLRCRTRRHNDDFRGMDTMRFFKVMLFASLTAATLTATFADAAVTKRCATGFHRTRERGIGTGPDWRGEPTDCRAIWRHGRYRGNDPGP